MGSLPSAQMPSKEFLRASSSKQISVIQIHFLFQQNDANGLKKFYNTFWRIRRGSVWKQESFQDQDLVQNWPEGFLLDVWSAQKWLSSRGRIPINLLTFYPRTDLSFAYKCIVFINIYAGEGGRVDQLDRSSVSLAERNVVVGPL